MDNLLDTALQENLQRASQPKTPLNKPVDDYLHQIKSFEEDRIALAQNSAKTAWKIAMGFGFIALLTVITLLVMMPLKQTEPYLLKVDSATGHTGIVKPLSDAEAVTYGEVLDKHWLNQFVIARNGYDWETIQNNYNLVKIMSHPTVYGAYSNYIRGDQSPLETFADKKVIRITVKGVTILPAISETEVLAQVRFTRHIENPEGKASLGYQSTHWTATLVFDYQAVIKTEDERQLNPLGFRVKSYREDRELNQ